MMNFAEEIGDENLITALHGGGAFSAFFDTINAKKLSEKFGEFQKNHYNKIFKKWCVENDIAETIKF